LSKYVAYIHDRLVGFISNLKPSSLFGVSGELGWGKFNSILVILTIIWIGAIYLANAFVGLENGEILRAIGASPWVMLVTPLPLFIIPALWRRVKCRFQSTIVRYAYLVVILSTGILPPLLLKIWRTQKFSPYGLLHGGEDLFVIPPEVFVVGGVAMSPLDLPTYAIYAVITLCAFLVLPSAREFRMISGGIFRRCLISISVCLIAGLLFFENAARLPRIFDIVSTMNKDSYDRNGSIRIGAHGVFASAALAFYDDHNRLPENWAEVFNGPLGARAYANENLWFDYAPSYFAYFGSRAQPVWRGVRDPFGEPGICSTPVEDGCIPALAFPDFPGPLRLASFGKRCEDLQSVCLLEVGDWHLLLQGHPIAWHGQQVLLAESYVARTQEMLDSLRKQPRISPEGYDAFVFVMGLPVWKKYHPVVRRLR
jgi:hypothetical protein